MNNDHERMLGKLHEFKEATLTRLDSIEKRIESLSHFKWQVVGGMSVIVALYELLIGKG